MTTQRIEEFAPHHEGCEAKLLDNGRDQTVPACMGGTALTGCNNADVCESLPQVEASIPSDQVYAIFHDLENPQIITGITRVARATLAD